MSRMTFTAMRMPLLRTVGALLAGARLPRTILVGALVAML